MTMYLPLPPDGSMPEGAAPDSPRYRKVVVSEVPPAYRLTLTIVGAAAVALGAAMMYAGNPFGILAGIGGMGSLVAGATGGASHDEYRRSPSGQFVRATREHEAEVVYTAWQHPRTPIAYRIAAGVLGAPAAAIFVAELFDPHDGADEWKTLLGVGALAAALLYIAVKGLPHWHDPEAEPVPPRFYEFADPTRPLPPEAFAQPESVAEQLPDHKAAAK